MKKYVFSFRLIISAFLLIMAFLTILYLSFNYVKINLRSNEVDKHFSGDFIQVVDAYKGSELHDLFQTRDGLSRMKTFYDTMKKEFDIYGVDNQDLYFIDSVKNFNYKEEFRADYETELYNPNEVTPPLMSIQLDQNSFNYFDLDECIFSGKTFSREDFDYVVGKEVPIILGYEYSEVATLGSRVQLLYLSQKIDAVVVGILVPNTSIVFNDEIVFLDRKILLPFFELSDSQMCSIVGDFANYLYTQKNWFYIKISETESLQYYINVVDKLNHELNLRYLINGTMTREEINNIGKVIGIHKSILYILGITFVLIVVLAFCFINIWSYIQFKALYRAYFLCGYSKKKIKRKVSVRIFLLTSISLCLSLIIYILLRNTLTIESIIITLIAWGCITFFSVVILSIFISYYNIIDSKK
ncbi:hypothetical protein [Hominenteromicrobium sp.]|uniref:hypothetical protein n=1 Tax=Hominenteromicrobium sp. TaxID=3073581 RepID=UPI003AB16E25